MRLEQRRVAYGFVIGSGAFIVGVLTIWLMMPVEEVDGVQTWKAAVWVFLEANGVDLNPGIFSPIPVERLPTVQLGSVYPALLVSIGAVLTASGVSGTGRAKYIFENALPVLYGYLGIGLIALLQSGARPGLAGFGGILLLLLAALAVGSRVLGSVLGGLPVFGVVSIGFVLTFGLFIIIVGAALLDALLPMIIAGGAGYVLGSGALWAVRQAPR